LALLVLERAEMLYQRIDHSHWKRILVSQILYQHSGEGQERASEAARNGAENNVRAYSTELE